MAKKFRPFFTLSFLLAVAAFSVFAHTTSQDSLYGLYNQNKDLYSFSTDAPFRNYLLTWLSSLFYHARLQHFLLNATLFLILSYWLERKLSPLKLFVNILFIHIATLLTLFFLTKTSLLVPAYYHGMSHIVFGLMALSFMSSRKFFLYCVVLAVQFFMLVKGDSNANEFASHLCGYTFGSVAYLFTKKNFSLKT